jgi:hypothetical protein
VMLNRYFGLTVTITFVDPEYRPTSVAVARSQYVPGALKVTVVVAFPPVGV